MEPAKFQYLSFNVTLTNSEAGGKHERKQETVVLNIIPRDNALHYVENQEVVLIIEVSSVEFIKEVPNASFDFVIKTTDKATIHHRLTCKEDRTTLLALLRQWHSGLLRDPSKIQSPVPIKEGVCKKKAKLRKTERYLILVKGRLLVCRVYASKYPIAAIFLTHAKVASSGPKSLLLTAGGEKYDYIFNTKDEKASWNKVLMAAARGTTNRDPKDPSFFVALRKGVDNNATPASQPVVPQQSMTDDFSGKRQYCWLCTFFSLAFVHFLVAWSQVVVCVCV